MDVHAQIALWFIATIFPFCLNSLVNRNPDAIGLSGMIVVGWCFERICWVIWSPPEAMTLYPVMDVVLGLTTLAAWGTRPAWWKLALTAAFLFQCCLHVAFWGAYPLGGASVARYEAVLNCSYAVELCLVASSGLGHVARMALDRMFTRSWHSHHAGR
jgi:hypothetical protein